MMFFFHLILTFIFSTHFVKIIIVSNVFLLHNFFSFHNLVNDVCAIFAKLSSFNLIIVSIYIGSNCKIEKIIKFLTKKIFKKYPNHAIILSGDFNAHHKTCGMIKEMIVVVNC